MSTACQITPISAFQSTNLNNKIETFNDLGDRIKRSLGWPVISVEVHQDQLFQNIQIAIEFFSKFAGYTEEYIVFDSNLYERNKGIRLDVLFTLGRTTLTNEQKVAKTSANNNPDYTVTLPPTVYVATSAINSSLFTGSSALSSLFTDGIYELELLDQTLYSSVTSYNTSLSTYFRPSINRSLSLQSQDTTATNYSNVYDYDLMDYRKVISVINFEEGSSQSINTLFTIEQTLAQQTYFSYAMGNYGFDLVSWYTVKEWLDTREKVLATRKDIKFDERTQYLTMYPQPGSSMFYGVLACYIERPIRDLIKEQWVYAYALALTKITIGRIRGRFSGVSLLGGGSLNLDILQEGLSEKAELEKALMEGANPGFGDGSPPCFFVG
jgi:hypothetical protein